MRSIFEHCCFTWHPQSTNQISKFDAIQKRAIKWIDGRRFDNYSNFVYREKQKEYNIILPIKLKFYLNDLILFYKISTIKCSIKPTCDGFRNCYFNRTMMLWNNVPYHLRQETRISIFKSAVTKFLWSADMKWPDKYSRTFPVHL